ncbi:putative 3-dehydrosphinganine reductase [Helianthus annuus]|nr:putative 3-dehydrosphinganine reductase [Helianthus annuus]
MTFTFYLYFLEIPIHLVSPKNKKKPRLTSIIAGSSGAMQADEVAKKVLNGIKSGSFIVPWQ